ncbi:MAG TPA: EthD family reductase [Candidatus Saccharimonadales bacterium]|nr:EthD family reductase [Candidatus Saccharimonadales bacterium]
MVRLIALYNQPDDPAAFDAHYRDVHAPIVRRYPNLRGVRLTTADGLGGRPSPFYLMAEMSFDSRSELDEAMASEAGRESGRDLRTFAQAGVTLFVADDAAATDA